MTNSIFVAADFAGSSKETATLLVGTAHEFDVPQREIAMVRQPRQGFLISQRLFDVLYDEGVVNKKTSGNRAVKKNSKKEKQHG